MFGLGSNYKIFKLRRRYDRVREKADRLGRRKGFQILKILDTVDNYIVQLEEQDLPMMQRKRMIYAVESAIERAKALLETDGQLRQPTDVQRNPR